MISTKQRTTPQFRQWQLLLIYNLYRFFCILFFFSYFIVTAWTLNSFGILYLMTLFVYVILGLFLLYCGKIHSPKLNRQVLFGGTLDIILTSTLISFLGDMRSGFIIFLNIIIAAHSIMVPGRLAIFFASIASCMLLGISFIEYLYGMTPTLSAFYSSGYNGVGFFATALTAWYLAHRINSSENIAYKRGTELAGMQRINEYVVERLHSGVIYIDLNRCIKLMNTAAKNFFNLKPNDMFENLRQLSISLDKKCQTFLTKTQHDITTSQIILDSPYLRVHFFKVSIDSETVVLIFLDDLSLVAQQAQQLKLASLGRLSASIAHELRNPLGAISHAVQLLGDTKQLNEEDLRLKELIINNCNRMNGVIKNILQLTRREKSQPEVINFYLFITQFKHDFCIYNQCDILITVLEKDKVFFVFDKSQLEQILIILCENSIQHGRDRNGIVTITISAKQNLSNTEIVLCDNGPGIPEHLQEDIFEPFFSTLRTGFGMGLFIAKDLSQVNQARLSMVPKTTGSCFTITISQSEAFYE